MSLPHLFIRPLHSPLRHSIASAPGSPTPTPTLFTRPSYRNVGSFVQCTPHPPSLPGPVSAAPHRSSPLSHAASRPSVFLTPTTTSASALVFGAIHPLHLLVQHRRTASSTTTSSPPVHFSSFSLTTTFTTTYGSWLPTTSVTPLAASPSAAVPYPLVLTSLALGYSPPLLPPPVFIPTSSSAPDATHTVPTLAATQWIHPWASPSNHLLHPLHPPTSVLLLGPTITLVPLNKCHPRSLLGYLALYSSP